MMMMNIINIGHYWTVFSQTRFGGGISLYFITDEIMDTIGQFSHYILSRTRFGGGIFTIFYHGRDLAVPNLVRNFRRYLPFI